MKLKESLKGLICEATSIERIIYAIEKRQVLIINYDGSTPGGSGIREIEPVAIGRSKSGNLVVRAWQREGASHRFYLKKRPIPGWRYFRLDKILSAKPTKETFDEMRPNYNTQGDKSMKSILRIAKFI